MPNKRPATRLLLHNRLLLFILRTNLTSTITPAEISTSFRAFGMSSSSIGSHFTTSSNAFVLISAERKGRSGEHRRRQASKGDVLFVPSMRRTDPGPEHSIRWRRLQYLVKDSSTKSDGTKWTEGVTVRSSSSPVQNWKLSGSSQRRSTPQSRRLSYLGPRIVRTSTRIGDGREERVEARSAKSLNSLEEGEPTSLMSSGVESEVMRSDLEEGTKICLRGEVSVKQVESQRNGGGNERGRLRSKLTLA